MEKEKSRKSVKVSMQGPRLTCCAAGGGLGPHSGRLGVCFFKGGEWWLWGNVGCSTNVF